MNRSDSLSLLFSQGEQMGFMNIKPSTKAFANPDNKTISRPSDPGNLTPEELKSLGGDNVGEVLNKIADPNWVDPNKKIRTVGNDKLDKDAFFKLMLAQLKNQDPTNPLKSHEMAAQLAGFSSLEQMQNMNTTLTDLKNGQKPMEQYQMLNLIGKSVTGDSSRLVRARGDKDHDIVFSLPDNAKETKILVKDADGEVVRTYTLNNLKKGDNKISWNGLNDKEQATPAGEYSFSIEAAASNGNKLAVKTDFNGTITGVNYTAEGPVMLIGNQTVRLRDVKKIIDPKVMNNDQNQSVNATQDLKSEAVTSQNSINTEKATKGDDKKDIPGAPEAKPNPQAALMQNVGMSRDLLNKVAKEVK